MRPFTPSPRKLVVFGDSFVGNGDALRNGSITSELQGNFVTALNILTGYRFNRQPGVNYGVAGDSTLQMRERLGAVIAAKPDIVVMSCGTNDANGHSPALAARILKSMIHDLNQNGALCLWPGIIPRPGNAGVGAFDSKAVLTALNINQLMRGHADENSGVVYFDMDEVCTDLTQASWAAKNGLLSADGVHLSVPGGFVYAAPIATYLNRLAPPANMSHSTQSDVYDAHFNTTGNLLPNGSMQGCVSINGVSGWSGTVPSAVSLAGAPGVSAVASLVTLPDGRRGVQVAFSGTVSRSEAIVLLQTVADPRVINAGDTLQGECYVGTAAPLGNVGSLDCYLTTNEDGHNYYQIAANSDGATPIPAAGYSGIIRTPMRTTIAVPARVSLATRISFVPGKVSGTVVVASQNLRKIIYP